MTHDIPTNTKHPVLAADNVTLNGDGIAYHDGKVVFVPRLLPGETAEVAIVEDKKRFARGEPLRLIETSPSRQEAPCGLFGDCGGCVWQHLNYDAVLRTKEQAVADALERIGGVDPKLVRDKKRPIVGMEEPFHYRNHVQFKIGPTRDDGLIEPGFYAEKSHRVVTGEPCLLVPESIYPIWMSFQKQLQHAFDLAAADGHEVWHHFYDSLTGLTWRTGDNGNKHLIILEGSFDKNAELSNVLAKIDIPQVVKTSNSEIAAIDQEITGVLLNNVVVYGEDFVTEPIGDKTYRVSANAFFQVNNRQTERLFDAARIRIRDAKDKLDPTGNGKIPRGLDLYCGSGTIGIYVADLFEEMKGIEINPNAIRDAEINAEINDVSNIGFECGRAEDYLHELNVDVLIVDPPRKGLDAALADRINETAIPFVLYISCNPATIARDLKTMSNYSLQSWQAFDLFPWCGHVETVVLLSHQLIKKDILIEFDPKDIELKPYKDATYEEIKDWVKKNYGFNVTNLYIGQAKEKFGLKKRKNYNISKKENQIVPQCPEEKMEAIKEAFIHFKMLDGWSKTKH